VRTVILLVASALGCASPVQGEEPVPPLDRATFDARVEPILERRCGNAECHGQPVRGLMVYAPLQYRADPARLWEVEPLSELEVRHNFESASVSARLEAWSGGSMLLKKPLGEHASEFHGGGAIFVDETDRDFMELRAWVEAAP
jgi:hypothetical protein